MPTLDPGFLLHALAAGAAAVWLAGAWFVARTRRLFAEPLAGEIEVELGVAALAQRLAREVSTARPGSPLQQSLVEVANERELRWSSTGAFRHRGRFVLQGDTKRTRVRWQAETGRGLLRAAGLVVVFGALVTLGLYLLLREFALPNENPGIRWQVAQMAQAVHLLWPPFLLAGIARRARRGIGNELRRIVQNAPFA